MGRGLYLWVPQQWMESTYPGRDRGPTPCGTDRDTDGDFSMTDDQPNQERLVVKFEFDRVWFASCDEVMWAGVFNTFPEALTMATEALTQVWKLCDRVVPHIEVSAYCPEFRPGQGNFA